MRKDSTSTYCEKLLAATLPDPKPIDENTQLDRVKSQITRSINENFPYKWEESTVQGCFLELFHLEQFYITWRSLIYNLPGCILQFAINYTIDTRAKNSNLKRWRKRATSKCKYKQKETHPKQLPKHD